MDKLPVTTFIKPSLFIKNRQIKFANKKVIGKNMKNPKKVNLDELLINLTFFN
jgi:hypothetical protein